MAVEDNKGCFPREISQEFQIRVNKKMSASAFVDCMFLWAEGEKRAKEGVLKRNRPAFTGTPPSGNENWVGVRGEFEGEFC